MIYEQKEPLLTPVIEKDRNSHNSEYELTSSVFCSFQIIFFFDAYLDTLLDRDLVGADMDLGVDGGLIGGRDASKLLDLTSLGLFVQTLGITLFNYRQGCVRIHLHKWNSCLVVQLPGCITVGNVWADKGRNCNLRRVGKELRHLGNAANVLCPGLGAKSEILVQTEADVVAVETIGGNLERYQVLLQSRGKSRLSGCRQTSEPDCQALIDVFDGIYHYREINVPTG